MTAALDLERLRPFLRRHGAAAAAASCGLCSAPLESPHAHVVDRSASRLCCACRACALLFSERREGRYCTVPARVRLAARRSGAGSSLERLGVPVNLAFFFRRSDPARWVAVLPSPAGANETELTDEAWNALLREHESLAALPADVEALLLRRTRAGALECYVCPIDRCYALVGLLREQWRGIDGGPEARARLEAFFAELRAAAQVIDDV